MVFSSSALNSLATNNDPYFMGWKQALFAGCGLGAMALLSQLDYRRWRSLSLPFLFLAIGLLCAVMVLPTEQGFHRAISVGPISIHAAEVAKLALVLFLADFLSRRGHALAEPRTLVPALAAIALCFALVLIEPDLGTATVVAGVGFAVFFSAGVPLRWVVGPALVAVALGVIGISLREYQAARLVNWFDPFSDPTGDSYQTLQGLIAIAVGGPLGTGIGTSQQLGGVIIPYAWNDYIFAVVGEEFGALGTSALIVGLGALTVVPLLFFGYATPKVPLSLMGLLQYINPTIQFILGLVVFNEAVTTTGIIGFTLVWIALLILAIEGVRKGRGARSTTTPIDSPQHPSAPPVHQ